MAPEKRKVTLSQTPEISETRPSATAVPTDPHLSIQSTEPPPYDDASPTPSKRIKQDNPPATDEEVSPPGQSVSLSPDNSTLPLFSDGSRSWQELMPPIGQLAREITLYQMARKQASMRRRPFLKRQLRSLQDIIGVFKCTWHSVEASLDDISADDLNIWLRSWAFKEPFMWLMKHYLVPQQYFLRRRAPVFEEIRQYLALNRRVRGVARSYIDGSDWIEAQWLASCVRRVYENDDKWRGSLFRNKSGSNCWQKYEIIYNIVKLARHESRLGRRSRIIYRLGLNADEQAELKRWSDAVPQPAATTDDAAPREVGLTAHAAD